MEGDLLLVDLQIIKTALESMKLNYLCLLINRDHIVKIAGIYVDQLSKGKNEIVELRRELKDAQEALDDTQVALLEAKD